MARIDTLKKKFKKFADGHRHHVCSFAWVWRGNMYPCDSHICHATVPMWSYNIQSSNNNSRVSILFDAIQRPYTHYNKKDGTEFLQYLMDNPVVGKSFHEHNAKKAMDEGMMVRRIDKLPSNVMMMSLQFTRALWEAHQEGVVRNWSKLVNLGMNKEAAHIIGMYLKEDLRDRFRLKSNQLCEGHFPVNLRKTTTNFLRNFVRGNLTNTSDCKMSRGFGSGGVRTIESFEEIGKTNPHDWAGPTYVGKPILSFLEQRSTTFNNHRCITYENLLSSVEEILDGVL